MNGMTGKDAADRPAFLDGLSRTQRLVLMMHFGDDLAPAEISAVLELPECRVEEIISDLRRGAARELAGC